MRLFLALAGVFGMVIAGILLSILLSLHTVDQSQHQWCQTLALLTAHPVPRPADPGSNPSREDAYVFYTNLKTLEHKFGC